MVREHFLDLFISSINVCLNPISNIGCPKGTDLFCLARA